LRKRMSVFLRLVDELVNQMNQQNVHHSKK